MHVRLPDGSLMAFPMPGPGPDVRHAGGAGLFGTMGDYGRFIRMILNDGELDGERVLAVDTVAQMVTNQMGSLRVEPMVSAMPQLTNDAEFFPGQPKSWGMSFQINDDPVPTGRPAGGLMWAGLANSYFWIDRATGLGGTYLTQILPFADPGSLALFTEFETAVYATRWPCAGRQPAGESIGVVVSTHEDHDHQAGDVERIAPRMSGPVLHDRVARAQLSGRPVVEFEDAAPGHDEFVVDRRRRVHPGVIGLEVLAESWQLVTELGEGCVEVEVVEHRRCVGRHAEEPEAKATDRRKVRRRRGLLAAVGKSKWPVSSPELEELCLRKQIDRHRLDGVVAGEDRLSVFIVARDHPSDSHDRPPIVREVVTVLQPAGEEFTSGDGGLAARLGTNRRRRLARMSGNRPWSSQRCRTAPTSCRPDERPRCA